MIPRSRRRALAPRGIPGAVLATWLALVAPAAATVADLSDGGVGRAVRCEITEVHDIPRTDIEMFLDACVSRAGAAQPGCDWLRFEQRGAVRTADARIVTIDWGLIPGDMVYYGTCQLCLTTWVPTPEHPDKPGCATSRALVLGQLGAQPLPEPGTMLGFLTAAAFLAIVAWAFNRLMK